MFAALSSSTDSWSPSWEPEPGRLHSACALRVKTMEKASPLVSLALVGEGLMYKLLDTQEGKCKEIVPILNCGKPQTSKKFPPLPSEEIQPSCLRYAQSTVI